DAKGHAPTGVQGDRRRHANELALVDVGGSIKTGIAPRLELETGRLGKVVALLISEDQFGQDKFDVFTGVLVLHNAKVIAHLARDPAIAHMEGEQAYQQLEAKTDARIIARAGHGSKFSEQVLQVRRGQGIGGRLEEGRAFARQRQPEFEVNVVPLEDPSVWIFVFPHGRTGARSPKTDFAAIDNPALVIGGVQFLNRGKFEVAVYVIGKVETQEKLRSKKIVQSERLSRHSSPIQSRLAAKWKFIRATKRDSEGYTTRLICQKQV